MFHDHRPRSLASRRLGLAFVCFLLAAATDVRPALGAEKPVLAVLYFDNNTGDKEFDVFQKGFADMMITDLAGVEDITVVERDKLQALLDEINLQKSSYFDKKTAIKLGKGLGARYAVTGAFQAVKPNLRINVRLIDIASGKVVVGTQVTGKDSEIFELEQKLVGKFVSAMKATFAPSGFARTKVPDVDTLLDYSKSIDLADSGDFRRASEAMSFVISRAPTFALARIRKDEMVRRLAAARVRRENTILEKRKVLAANAERYLNKQKLSRLSQDQAKNYIAYRAIRGRFIMQALIDELSDNRGLRVVLSGKENKVKKLMKAYYGNGALLIRELELYAKRFTKTYPNGITYLDTGYQLPKADKERAQALDMDRSFSRETRAAREEMARFILLGRGRDLGGDSVTMAPPMSRMLPKFTNIGYGLLDKAWAEADAAAKKQSHRQNDAASALQLYAEALFLHGQKEKAIGKLQQILDRYPTYRGYSRVEKQIKTELGLDGSRLLTKLQRYARGLKQCKDMDLRVGMDGIIYQRMRLSGLAGIDQTVVEIEKHCKGHPKAKRYFSYLYQKAALKYGRHGICDRFEDYMKRYLAHGGSASSVRGWRKNYTKCPVPGQ